MSVVLPVSAPPGGRVRALLTPLVQLGGLAAVAWALGLEAAAGLPAALAVATIGWAAHELAPPAWKPRVFLALSLAILGGRLGWGAAIVVGAGLVLAEIPVLPIRPAGRVALAVAAAIELAWVRLRYGAETAEGLALAVLGSMFMFRTALVLLDPSAARVPRIERWTYFFQWPNALFPLYPVIDWAAWTRPPASPPAVLHRRGIAWIVRGFWHLLAYRLVYHLVLPADWEVVDAWSLVWWMVGSFLLYVRISGVFHVAVGLLLLFGRDLPRTQNRYFLASSFSDHYRRVNVPWTSFLENTVFLPVWFGLRRRKVPHAHVLAVLPTFAASWALHHWQGFWIAGQVRVTATDTAFWGILGLLVAANTAWATLRPATARRGRRLAGHAVHAAKVVGTFASITLLWSLWKSETFGAWFARLGLLADGGAALGIVAGLAAAVAVGTAVGAAAAHPAGEALRKRVPADGLPGLGCAALAAVALAVMPPVPAEAPAAWRAVRTAIAGEHLSARDRVVKTHGYYDDLAPAAPIDPTARPSHPPGWQKLRETRFVRPTGPDLPFEFELVPSARGLFHGVPFRTNAHGMRDREVAVDKPPGTYRIALLGASPEMGEGVADDEVFSVLVEEQLNRRAGAAGRRFEVLNFAVSGRTLEGHAVDYRRRVRPFRPDLVLVADHTGEGARTMLRLARNVRQGRAFPGEVGPAAAAEVGVLHATWAEATTRLAPYTDEVLRELYGILVRDAAEDGAKVVWLGVPLPADLDLPGAAARWRERHAVAAGMIPISLDGAYLHHSRHELEVAPWDAHPNRLGHRLLARRLVRELVARDAELWRQVPPAVTGPP